VLATSLTGYGLMGGPTQPDRGAYQLDPSNGATVLTIPVGHSMDAMARVLGDWTELTGVAAVGHPVVELAGSGRTVTSTSVDHVAVSGLLGDDVVASVHMRPGSPPPARDGLRWEITGTDGTIEVTGGHAVPQMTALRCRAWDARGELRLAWDEAEGDPLVPPLLATWAAIAATVRGGSAAHGAPAGFGDAVRLHELIGGVGPPLVRPGRP